MNNTLTTSNRKGFLGKRWFRLLLEVTGSLLALVLLFLILIMGRLSMGPINLDFLTKEIEEAFVIPEAGISATIEHTQLVWRDWKHPFEIELVGARFKKGQNPEWLRIENIAISLRVYRLLVGEISLGELRFYHPQILFEKDEKGNFSLGFGERKVDQEFSFKELAPLLALGGSHIGLGKLNDLNRISIIDAAIVLKDDTNDLSWDLPKCTFVLDRYRDGFQADLTLYPKEGNDSFNIEVDHKLNSSRFDISATFNHISFKQLIKSNRPSLSSAHGEDKIIDDILNLIQHWNIPLNGNAHVALYPETLQIIEGRISIDFGKGELDLSGTKLLPFPVNSGNLTFLLTPQEIKVQNAALLSDEMLLNFSGTLLSTTTPLQLTNLFKTGQVLQLNGKVEDLSLDHLAAIWPQEIGKYARNWLTQNMRKGIIRETTFVLKGRGSDSGLIIDDLNGTIKGENAEVTYLEGLPPAQHVNANATFDKQGFDIKVLTGEVQGIKLKEGRVLIEGLDGNHESLRLEVKAKAPLPDVLDIIDHKPLEYASYGGIDPKKTKGNGDVTMKIAFPLVEDLQFKDVKIDLKGTFTKVEVGRDITPQLKADLKNGNFKIDLTHEQMIIKGKGVLNHLESNLTYTHHFKNSKKYQLQIEIETGATFDDFKRFGFDYTDYAKGKTNTKIIFTMEHDKKSRLVVNLDTTASHLSFPPLEWEKKSGEKGRISFALVFKDGHLSKMKNIEMTSATYSLKGDVLFGPQKTWSAVHLSEFKGPHMNAQVSINRTSGNSIAANFKGPSVDVEKFLQYVEKGPNDTNHPPTDIKLEASVDSLRMGEGKIFKAVHANADLFLQGKDHTWRRVHLRAKAGQGTANKGDMAHISGGILFDITPGPNNTQTLEVRANDAGQFLKNLSIYEEIRGGYITIKAKRKNEGPYVGVFKLKNFDANEIPLLARFAALLSPMGLANLFSSNKAISMDGFKSDFEFSDKLIVVKNGIGKSISLGFTVEGKLDRVARTYSLKGNIIPARFINSILNNIPIIGSLISGGEGEGLFAISYTVKNSFASPTINLNPLSALAPGFIRKIFQSIGNDEE